MIITKIVSGAQTGAERGGLDAAIDCGLPYGGWIPKGRRAEDGIVPETYADLSETASKDYIVRTEANVVDSAATLVLARGAPTGGSLMAAEFAVKHKRPHLTVDLNIGRAASTDLIVRWLNASPLSEGVLNVSGSLESKSPGIQEVSRRVLVEVLSAVNGELYEPGARKG
jgi:hypothetical protein